MSVAHIVISLLRGEIMSRDMFGVCINLWPAEADPPARKMLGRDHSNLPMGRRRPCVHLDAKIRGITIPAATCESPASCPIGFVKIADPFRWVLTGLVDFHN